MKKHSYLLLPPSVRQPPITEAELLSDRLHAAKDNLKHLPQKGRRVSIELAGLAALAFFLSLLLANSSGDLRGYRAYFLSTARDVSIVLVGSLAVWRFLNSRKENQDAD